MGSNDEALSNPILGWEDEEDPTRGPEKENCLKWEENHDVWCEVRKVWQEKGDLSEMKEGQDEDWELTTRCGKVMSLVTLLKDVSVEFGRQMPDWTRNKVEQGERK